MDDGAGQAVVLRVLNEPNAAMDGAMEWRAAQVAPRASEYLGRPYSYPNVSATLKGPLLRKGLVTRRVTRGRWNTWSLTDEVCGSSCFRSHAFCAAAFALTAQSVRAGPPHRGQAGGDTRGAGEPRGSCWRSDGSRAVHVRELQPAAALRHAGLQLQRLAALRGRGGSIRRGDVGVWSHARPSGAGARSAMRCRLVSDSCENARAYTSRTAAVSVTQLPAVASAGSNADC